MELHLSRLRPAVFTTICLISLLHMKVSSGINKWDDLEVRWGPKPSPEFFVEMPRTSNDARRQGFVKISDCHARAKWRGARYVRNNDPAITLLFDINGFIAGIQTSIPKYLLDRYPRMKWNPVFVEDGRNVVVTAYFVDPALICTRGRNQNEFSSQGTGIHLYIQNGTNPEYNSVLIPSLEREVPRTKWMKGFCFPTMGVHYWYDLSERMDCEALFPVFLLYNKGELNAFGWALMLDYSSPLYEHTTTAVASRFMKPVPECLKSIGKVSTLHIYMAHDPSLRQC